MKIKNLKRFRRRTLMAASFCNVFGWALLSPLYAIYVEQLGGNPQVAALAWAFYTLLGGVLMVVLGWWESRISNKERIMVLGFVLQLAGVGLLFTASDIPTMIAGYGVYAVGTGFVVPVWNQAFTRVEIRSKATAEWGMLNGGNMLLISAAAAISSVIYGFAGFKGILGLMFVAHLMGAILGVRLARAANL